MSKKSQIPSVRWMYSYQWYNWGLYIITVVCWWLDAHGYWCDVIVLHVQKEFRLLPPEYFQRRSRCQYMYILIIAWPRKKKLRSERCTMICLKYRYAIVAPPKKWARHKKNLHVLWQTSENDNMYTACLAITPEKIMHNIRPSLSIDKIVCLRLYSEISFDFFFPFYTWKPLPALRTAYWTH